MRFVSDVRLAWRSLIRGRSVTVFAVLAFALGIGITTAVFSIFYSVLVKPLPFPDPDQLVIVYDVQPACATCPASYTKYIDWKTRSTSFAAMGGSSTMMAVITGNGDPERVPASPVTWTLLDVFRVAPEFGRWFNEDEDKPGGPKVMVLSYGYWQRRFAGDRGVLGRTFVVNGEPHQVIGVMPREFTHRGASFFVPVQRVADPAQRGNHFLQTYARMKPGVTVEQAQREMKALGTTLAAEFKHNHGIDVGSYYRAVVGNVEQPLRVLMGAVTLVLLIATANVANLLLAAGLARRRELAVRSALGATRWDLTRQLTIESIMLAVIGGALGLMLAQWSLSTFVALAGTTLPRAAGIAIDGWVLGFAAALSCVTGAICGLWPVLRLKTHSLASAVREGDLRGGTSAGGRRFGQGLVIVEIAVAFALLAGAGLLIKNLMSLEARDTGFVADRVVTFDVAPTGARYKGNDAINEFYRQLMPRLAAIPDVQAVGATSHLPMHMFGWNGEVTLDGGNPWDPKDAPLIERSWIDPSYMRAMGIEIIAGRGFDDRDRIGGPPVTILSKRTADKFWPGQDPIGRRLWRDAGSKSGTPHEVIGVARDVRTYGLGSVSPYIMYMAAEQEPFGAMTIVARSKSADPTAFVSTARQIVTSIDPALPVSRVQTLNDVVAQSVRQPRLISALTTLFATLAGILAAVGVYGVMAYNVRRERREFGIRLALGADPGAVHRLVVVRGLVLGAIGILLGAAGAWLLSGTLQSLLSDVKPGDPAVYATTAGLLLLVALAAVYLPARQASRTDPMVALQARGLGRLGPAQIVAAAAWGRGPSASAELDSCGPSRYCALMRKAALFLGLGSFLLTTAVMAQQGGQQQQQQQAGQPQPQGQRGGGRQNDPNSRGGGNCAANKWNCIDTPNPLPKVDTVWLEEMTWMDVRDAMAAGKTTVIISTGGIEPNGPFLALGKHNYVLKANCEAIARKLGNALCAPIDPFVPEGAPTGSATGHMNTMGTISLREETFQALLTDIVTSLKSGGFKNIMLIGDSGGNGRGMGAVATKLNAEWNADPVVAHIPQHYDVQHRRRRSCASSVS